MPSDALPPISGPEDEIPLPGGNVGGAVRVGDSVRRPTGPWTPAVHELLDFLADAGLERRIQRVLGIDDRDREILTFLPGRVLEIGREDLSDAQVRSAIAWLRGVPRGPSPGFPRGASPVAVRGARACSPGESSATTTPRRTTWRSTATSWQASSTGMSPVQDIPLDDVSIFAWNSAVLFPDADADEVAHVLRTLADGYGGLDPHATLDHVLVRVAGRGRPGSRQRRRQATPACCGSGTVGEPASHAGTAHGAARSRLPVLHEALDR